MTTANGTPGREDAMTSTKKKIRAWLVGLAAVTGLALSAANALAVFPNDQVASYAGCLNTSGTAAGTFAKIAAGDEPSSPCGPNQAVIHLSGGDITSVVAGQGLSGGGTNGATTLSLAAGQSLPQTCSNGQIPEWNGTGWSCGVDNDTTYSNGTGLDLSGTNAFSVKPSYRLPQSCGAGQVAKWDSATGAWSCANDTTGGGLPNAYQLSKQTAAVPNGDYTWVADMGPIPAGDYFVSARMTGANLEHDSLWYCELRRGGTTGEIIGGASGKTEDLTLGDFLTFTSSTILVLTHLDGSQKLTLTCGDSADSGTTIDNIKIVAVQVGSISSTVQQ
jgi:hypothetical protein